MADKKRKVDFSGDLRGNGLIDPETTVTYTEIKADGGKREITDYGVKNSGEMTQPGLKNQTGNDALYDGKYMLTDDKNDNGVKQPGVNSLINGTDDNLKGEGKNNSVNDVTKAVSGMGLSNAVQYGKGGVVTVAGIPVKNGIKSHVRSVEDENNFEEVGSEYADLRHGFGHDPCRADTGGREHP